MPPWPPRRAPEQDHALARGGDACLVVWSDYRGQAVGGGTNQSGGDIFGIRLDAAGQPLDAAPFLVAGGMGLQERPLVAWGTATAWLVLYQSQETGRRLLRHARPRRARERNRPGAGRDAADAAGGHLHSRHHRPAAVGVRPVARDPLPVPRGRVRHLPAGQRIGANGQFLDPAPIMLMDWVYGQTVTVVGPGEYLVAGPGLEQ